MIPMVKTGVSLEAIKSKPKIRGKLGHVVQIHVCHLA